MSHIAQFGDWMSPVGDANESEVERVRLVSKPWCASFVYPGNDRLSGYVTLLYHLGKWNPMNSQDVYKEKWFHGKIGRDEVSMILIDCKQKNRIFFFDNEISLILLYQI